MSRPSDGLLDGLTVLDFTRVLAGPYCTRLLADLGARVVKIERPRVGDDTRVAPLQLEAGRQDQSAYFVRLNAGKRSVALDLSHPEARPVAVDLARVSDVVVENFLPGTMARFGLDYPSLASIRPGLVYCSISGYGQTGPWKDRPAFAHVVHAMSGLMHLERDGDLAPRPLYLQAADVIAGTHAFGVILAALVRRGRTGAGAYLDVAMLEALVAAEDITFESVLNGGEEYRGPRPGMVAHLVGDRLLAMQTVGSHELWPRLLALLDKPQLASDPRFRTPVDRRRNWAALREEITAWLDRFTDADEALAALARARLPCAPALTPAEVTVSPHLAERRAFPSVPHPTAGSVRVTASPYHVDGGPLTPAGPAPYGVGEDTRDVLAALLGYAPDRIEALITAGAIAVP